MPIALTMNTRLDHAKTLLEQLAAKAPDAQTRSEIASIASAVGVAENRISSLEFVINGLAKKVGLKRGDLGQPITKHFSDGFVNELLK